MKQSLLLALITFFITTARAGQLKVLTYNTWILEAPLFGKDLSEDLLQRLNALPTFLDKKNADMIVLQEVWKEKHKRALNQDKDSVTYDGLTFSPENQYIKDGKWRGLGDSERVDYIITDTLSPLTVRSSEIVFKESVDTIYNKRPKILPALSDHFGLFTTFEY